MKAYPRTSLQLFFFTICLITLTSSLYSKNCHYSCTYCVGPEYDRCIICQDGLKLNPVKNKDKIGQLYYNWLQEHPAGSCLGEWMDFNIFGIATFAISVILFIIIKNRTIFYFFNAIQTFALFSLIEVGYSDLISYVLKGLQHFMLMSFMLKDIKQQKIEIYDDGRYRLYEFMREYNFQANFLPVFIASASVFVLTFVMPVCKHFAKKQNSLWSVCSCVNMQKVFTFLQICSIAVFFFLIQEIVLIIVVGVFLNKKFIDDPLNIALVVVYALLFVVMMINLCSKNLDLFGNKALEQTEIVKKCLTPVFVIMPVNLGIILPGFMFFIAFLGLVFSRIRPADKTLTQFHEKVIKREFAYRIIELLAIGGIISFWVVENNVQTLNANQYAGYASTAIIGVYIICFLVEAGILLFGRFWKKEDQRLYETGVSSMSSMRQTKMEDTLENFQTTEEGIMDMIFFGRNIEQKQSPKKNNNNIQLTLDHLNDEFEEQPDDKMSKSATTSPKHRDFKNRTSRTPKNDRSARFKLNKVSEPQNKEVQIEYVNMNQETITNENTNHVVGSKSQRNENYPQVKTGRKYESFKTGREIKAELNDEEKSPRFGVDVPIDIGFYKDEAKDTRVQGKFNYKHGKSSLN